MSKPRIIGAFAPYTPNRKMDERFNRKWHKGSNPPKQREMGLKKNG